LIEWLKLLYDWYLNKETAFRSIHPVPCGEKTFLNGEKTTAFICFVNSCSLILKHSFFSNIRRKGKPLSPNIPMSLYYSNNNKKRITKQKANIKFK